MDYITSLNPEQREIVTNKTFLDEKSALCIIACAGAGKTRTLISKIIYMVRQLHCDPKDFFITTFTRNAANELRERLTDILTEDEVNMMTLGTFHSIAYNKINSNENFDYPVEDNIEGYLYRYSTILSGPECKNLMIRDGILYDGDGNIVNESADISNDIIVDVSESLFTDHEYKYVFIDEYQDINEVQERIIRALYSRAKLLVVVGDDQQNIYTFRDTKIEYILNFTKNYVNSQYAYLIKNYRCNTNFVTLANMVLSYNKNKIDKTIIAMKKDQAKKVMMVSFKNQRNQLQLVIDKILTSESVENLHNVAILARNNKVLKNLESMFAGKGIPTTYIDSNNSFRDEKINLQDVSGRLILSTIHGTKGLEFDSVYILDVNSSCFPSTKCNDIEEERRLFYVAITRPKKKLYICYDEKQPSQFINEIKKHEWFDQIVTHKKSEGDNIIVPITINKGLLTEDYSVSNIISKMNYIDYEDFRNNIFDYHIEIPEIDQLHPPIPEYFGEFFADRNPIITNLSSTFYDFIETYIMRTIQHSTNSEIENLDYTIYALHYYKKGIDDIKKRKHDQTIEENFGITLTDKSDEYINRLVLYYQTGVKINSYIDKDFLSYFVNSYKKYISNRPSKDIIFDIFVVSLIKGIIRGRNSILHLINFDKTKFDMDKINKNDITHYKDWLIEIENSYDEYFNKTSKLNTSFAIFDKETKVKAILDIRHNDSIIKIKSNPSIKPTAETLIHTMAHTSLMKVNEENINKCSIYNPLSGYIYTWNLDEWNQENDVIFYLTGRMY